MRDIATGPAHGRGGGVLRPCGRVAARPVELVSVRRRLDVPQGRGMLSRLGGVSYGRVAALCACGIGALVAALAVATLVFGAVG